MSLITTTTQGPGYVPIADFGFSSTQVFQDIAKWAVDNYPAFLAGMKQFGTICIILSIPLSVALIIGIVYCVQQLKAIRKKEHDLYDLKVEEAFETGVKGDATLSKRWESVMRQIESNNQNDWRQAIMEADIILDDLLNKMEYHGESIGEKLKRVEKADFNTLDEAFEAHRFRNRIAHDGSAKDVSQYEAKRIINLYKKVFEEFYYV